MEHVARTTAVLAAGMQCEGILEDLMYIPSFPGMHCHAYSDVCMHNSCIHVPACVNVCVCVCVCTCVCVSLCVCVHNVYICIYMYMCK